MHRKLFTKMFSFMSFSSSVSIFTFAALTMQLQQTHFPKKRIISKDSYTYLIGRSMTMWFHCCWGFNTITILESWTNSNQFQLSFLAMCFSNQWTNRCGKICTWHLDFGKRESTVYSCNCNWGSGEATVATQILSFWTRLCNWGKNLKGFLPNHIKEAADAHRFRLRKPLRGREWVAFCALLPLPVPGIRPTGVWSHVITSAAILVLLTQAKMTELHFGVMMSRMWCHYTVCDDVRDFFPASFISWFTVFCASVKMLVMMLGRGRGCVLFI